MKNKAMFTSNSVEWYTPLDLFKKLDEKYHFTLDVCATDDSALCSKYFTKEIDGLKQNWTQDICWMNPPYGKEIYVWMKKAYEAKLGGATVVCLVPSRTDTRWWHEFSMKGEIEFIKGRLRFRNSKWVAPFPSAIVVFKGLA